MSKRRTELWASISAWIVSYDSGWTGCNYVGVQTSAPTDEVQLEIDTNVGICRALNFSHGEACRMDRIEISSV
ncbi:unnamed protein product [Prunus armeniaca]